MTAAGDSPNGGRRSSYAQIVSSPPVGQRATPSAATTNSSNKVPIVAVAKKPGSSGSRSKSRSKSRSRSRSPHSKAKDFTPSEHDEVVPKASRAPSPPQSASTSSASPPARYIPPRPASPSSSSALGMSSWGTSHNSARRGSTSSSGWGAADMQPPPGIFVDRTSPPHGRRASYSAGPPLHSHAAELMHIAARKMAQKEEERASALHLLHSQQQQSQREEGEISDKGNNDDNEEYDQFDLPKLRARSKSISSYDPVLHKVREFHVRDQQEPTDLAAIWGRVQASQTPRGDRHVGDMPPPGIMSGPATTAASAVSSAGPSSPAALMQHRRSSTFSYQQPGWGTGGASTATTSEAPSPASHYLHPPYGHSMPGSTLNSLPGSPERVDRLRTHRRFSVSPTLSTGDYDQVAAQIARRSIPIDHHMSPRRHSVAGPLAYRVPGQYLADVLSNMTIEEQEAAAAAGTVSGYNHLLSDVDEYYDQQQTHQRSMLPDRRASVAVPGHTPSSSQLNGSTFQEVGRGVPLHALPSTTTLYIVEFKAGRSDIFYVAEGSGIVINKGDLVIVEADRGKDLGKVVNNSITPHQIHMLQAQQSEALNELHRVNREIHPKRIYRLAQPQEVAMLVTKAQDESKAMAVCATKVRQKKLPMEVVDCEYQWDRRKLTFYFVADRRIDFRELVRDLFKIYKTRIWMCAVNAITKAPQLGPSSPKEQAVSLPMASEPALGMLPHHAAHLQQQHGSTRSPTSPHHPSPVLSAGR